MRRSLPLRSNSLFGPAWVIHHLDPLLAIPDLIPAARSNCPPLCSSFWMLLPGDPVTVIHFVTNSKATCSLITIPHQLRGCHLCWQHEQTAASTTRSITGPTGLTASTPLGPALTGSLPRYDSSLGNHERQQLLTATETSSAPTSPSDQGEGNITQTDYNCASGEANLLIYRNYNK